MSNIEKITSYLSAQLNGEPSPAMRSPERAEIMAAISDILNDPDDRNQLALKVLGLVTQRLQVSLIAERQMAIMRDSGSWLC